MGAIARVRLCRTSNFRPVRRGGGGRSGSKRRRSRVRSISAGDEKRSDERLIIIVQCWREPSCGESCRREEKRPSPPFLVPDRKTGCLVEKREEGMAIPSLMEYNDRHPGMRDREMDRSPSGGFVSGADPFESRRGRTAGSTGVFARSQSSVRATVGTGFSGIVRGYP